MVFSPPYRLWLLADVALLVTLTVWGVVRYPRLPDRIPEHIGIDGVDAWTDRSIGSAFVLVFLYAGVTVLMILCTEMTLRITPRDELPPGKVASSLVNRPGSRASARRTARALLVLNTCIGLSFLVGCGVLWRSAPEPEVPVWVFVAMLVPILAGTAVTVAAALRDRKR